MTVFAGNELETADLIVDALYEGILRENRTYADPLNKLVNVSNRGGFRYRGTKDAPTLVVLTSNLAEPDWPDELDAPTGRFVYYGDNRKHGRELHETGRYGNHLLRIMFDCLHLGHRHLCPPVLIFTALRARRAFVFRGLCAPGFAGVPPTQDLVAIWKATEGQRFQNYRAVFTVLDAAVVPRQWIDSAKKGLPPKVGAPEAWVAWVESGTYRPLQATATRSVRTKQEQLPESDGDRALIECVRSRFSGRPADFEVCAAEIARLLLRDVTDLEVTRPWRDGGRDAIGKLRLGRERASIAVTFALEAKCYGAGGVGVAEVSRLISRIRHREFGVLVTTTYLDAQAYKEVVEDGHPVIVVCARDIVALLREAGYATVDQLSKWLDSIDPGSELVVGLLEG
ncbi:restriction endonuclease [Betaproteobacteria bacterium PRO7]|jgi:hypothetical protein|nr:restriction endonuclease [Betaproteobacteria bacterium PRO7]